MTETHALTVRRTVAAEPAAVFAAWTEPASLRAWYGLDDAWQTPSAEVDLRVGGRYSIALQPPGAPLFNESGEYHEIDPPKRLVYTCTASGDSHSDAPEQTLVTVTFEPVEGGTEVTVVEEGYKDSRRRDMHESGWPRFLARLDHLVAGA